MKDMVLSNRYSTFQELVTDYDLESWEWAYSINDNRSITFEIPLTYRNKIIYDKLLPDMLILWNNQYYTILTADETVVGGVRIKTIETKHIFMEAQYVYIERDLSKDKLNDDEVVTDDKGVIQDNNTSTPNQDVSTGIIGGSIDVVADKVYNFFIKRGLTKYQIAGILGNLKAESSMDPSAEQFPDDPNKGGKGLAQWDDRKYNLYKYAEENNTTWQDPDLQIQFMWYEFNNSEINAFNRLKKTKNTREAALVFHRYYERSADTPEMEKRRVTYALEYQKMLDESTNNDEIANSDWLDLSKGINYGFGTGGDYEQETGVNRHDGIDVNYIYDPVHSVIKGIATVGWDPNGYGNYVIVSDGNGLEVIYGHLSEIDISDKQQVYTGTQLGVSGNTGFSTGPHLHFELRNNGVAFDPMQWIEDNKGGTTSEDDTTSNNTEKDKQDLYSVNSYLDYGFANNNLGFTYEIVGKFDTFKEVEKIGDKNLLQHIVDGAEIFGYIYYADNKKVYIYDKASWYELKDEPIIYKYNSDQLDVKTSII